MTANLSSVSFSGIIGNTSGSMKKKFLMVAAIILVMSGLFLLFKALYSFKDIGKGGLQVTANIQGKVFLNGENIGEIPVRKLQQKDTLKIGTYELRIEPSDLSLSAYTTRIRINSGVLTAVDKTFLPGSLGSSYVLTLEKNTNPKPQIEITSIPDGALVTIDSNALGATPYKSDALTASEHEIEIQKEGFAKKTIRVKTVANHKLIVNAQLGTGDNSIVQEATPTPIESPTPLPSLGVEQKKTVKILKTPNGFLRVRKGPGTSFAEVARVKTGETYVVVDEQTNWYKISVDGNLEGWITSQYTEVSTSPL